MVRHALPCLSVLVVAAAACHSDLRQEASCDPFHTPRTPDAPVVRGEERSIHAPYAAGDCAACHEPRVALAGESAEQARLPGPALNPVNDHCNSCHDERGRGIPKRHPPEQSFCITCHDPHASRQRSLLLPEDRSRACLTYSPPFRAQTHTVRRRAPQGAATTASSASVAGPESEPRATP